MVSLIPTIKMDNKVITSINVKYLTKRPSSKLFAKKIFKKNFKIIFSADKKIFIRIGQVGILKKYFSKFMEPFKHIHKSS